MGKHRSFLRDFGHVILGNGTVALVTALSVLIIPRFIGVEEYGYWQLFVFMSSYSLFLQFGFSDGVYLRYGGIRNADLNSLNLGYQVILLSLGQLSIGLLLALLAPLLIDDSDRVWIVQLAAVFCAIANVRHFFVLLLQALGKFNLFSLISILDRALFSTLVVILLVSGTRDYRLLIGAELAAKAASLVLAVLVCRRLLTTREGSLLGALGEMSRNVRAGVKLTFSNTGNMLIIGIPRAVVDRAWGIAIFGTVSLLLNLTTLFTLFVTSAGFAIFPKLKRIALEQRVTLYRALRLPLSTCALGVLILYEPILRLMVLWLPAQAPHLSLFVFLFPMVIFETRMGLLINPYLKAFRREGSLLVVNLLSACLSAVIVLIAWLVFESLELTFLSIVLALGVRAVLAESVLLRSMDVSEDYLPLVEIAFSVLFVVSATMVGGWLGMGIYTSVFLLRIILSRQQLLISFKTVKKEFGRLYEG